ncbi:type II secretion system F family protein [Sanguibacter sp. A247]|uniref:type II secretion system F family protein n=1 Tax=unclassified Sanguibacter TaxID=2645534 RepID=UPI003FD89F43
MDVVVGLLLGCGLLLVWMACWPTTGPRTRSRAVGRLADDLAGAGLSGATPASLLAVSAVLGTLVAVGVGAATRALPLAACFGLIAATVPTTVIRARASSRAKEMREVWPEVVDHLVSGVRAGLSLPEALGQLAHRGPVQVRAQFARFATDHRASGRFDESLDDLKARLADPVADRLIESLRITRQVGGTDLGRLLRTLSAFLREDNRTRGELEARQSWTVAGARLAVVAPWVMLALLATRPGTAAAYATAPGAIVLAAGGLACVLAYRAMVRIGRLPTDKRVLR